MKKKICLILALMVLLSLTGCISRTKTLLDTDSLTISQEGGRIVIYDVSGDNVYNFRIVHKKPSKRLTEPYTAVNSDTLLIEQRHKEIILTVKKCKNKYTLRIGKIFPIISVKKGVYDENFR